MTIRPGSSSLRAPRRRSFLLHRALIGAGTIVVLTLAGCASSVAGSPVAADAVLAADQSGNGAGGDSGNGDMGGLPAPTDGDGMPGASGSAPDLTDLQGILDGLGGEGGNMPDLSDLEGLMSGLTGAPGADGDMSGLLDQLGAAGVLSPGCLQVSGVLMSLGFLFMSPAMGQSIDAQAVQDAFKSAADLPAELQGAIQTLHQAAESAVGKSGADAQAIVSDPAVNGALDHLSQYLDSSCGGN